MWAVALPPPYTYSGEYKGNVIVYLVVGIGVIGTLFALFPQLLETPTLNMGATFPGDL